MDDINEPGGQIEDVLSESALLDDDDLRVFLAGLQAEATAVQPIPSHAVSRLMRRHRRAPSRRGRVVVAVIVGASVLAGGAAAASPLSPISGSATAIVSGLFGGAPADVEPATVSSDPPQNTEAQPSRRASTAPPAVPDDPGSSSTHPTPDPQSSHAVLPPEAQHGQPGDPNPHPTPHSTHADGGHG